MTRILLDTHVFLWWASANSQIRPAWVEAITDADNTVFLSAVAGRGIETKKRVRKLGFDDDLAATASEFGFEHLAITMTHATAAGSLDWSHRDPFDRMLAAQAIANDLVLLTADADLASAPGVRVL